MRETKTKDNLEKPASSAVEHRIVDRRRVFFSRLKRKVLRHVWLVRVCLVVSLIFISALLTWTFAIYFKKSSFNRYLELANDFVFTPHDKIKSVGGRTNLLILGKGGEGHEAPDITDTIVFASIPLSGKDSSNKKSSINLISIPRDIWIPEIRAKLNSTYYWGNKKGDKGGLILAKATVEKVIGQPVQYVAVIDFSGFKKIVDVVGGIEVDVKNSFTDEKYPIAGKENDTCGGDPEYKCRYETLHFVQGRQMMDGERALKFVRSRNASGDEGNDFARAARQQKVIEAIKKKVLSRDILLSPKKTKGVYEVLLSSVETDLDPSAAAILARAVFDERNNINSFVLPESLLTNPEKSQKYDNLYVFIPKNGDWSKVHDWTLCIISRAGDCSQFLETR